MIEERNEIPLEELDKDVSKGKYLLVKTGGYHPFYEVKKAPEKYQQNIWPWIKKIGGNLQHKKKLGKINGSISVKKPYINYTVEKNVDVFVCEETADLHFINVKTKKTEHIVKASMY